MLGAFASWFKALSVAGKAGVVTSSVIVGGTGMAAVSTEPTTPPPSEQCVAHTTQEIKKESIAFGTKEIKDPNLEKDKTEIRTAGVNGENKLTYEVTEYSPAGCESSSSTLAKKEVVKKPVTQVTAIGTYVPPVVLPEPPVQPPDETDCDPNYSGCVPIASDVDCAGGSGNGPAYVSGPVRVTGYDKYGLDADNDGYGCE